MEKKKNNYLQPVFVIGLSLLFTFIMFYVIKSAMTTEDVNIYSNTAEKYYYEGKYEESIAEYEKMKQEDEWPIWLVKEAQVYSIKGDLNKSISILKEAVLIRNKLIEQDSKKYIDKDSEFMNEVVLTFYMNEEYDQAISLGNDYLVNKNSTYKPLIKTMFSIYAGTGKENLAKKMIEAYPVDEKSAYDLAVVAEMEMVLKHYDDGFILLKQAYDIDKNEMKVIDVVRENALSNKDSVIKKLNQLIEKYPDQGIYKLWLAEAYVTNGESNDNVINIINSDNTDMFGELSLDVVKATYYINEGNKKYSEQYINKLINNEESKYIGYYLQGKEYYNREDYDKALLSAKKSIIANREFSQVYGSLIPDILLQKSEKDSILPYYFEAYINAPYNFNVIMNIGDYYKNTALNLDLAENYYNEALNLNPISDELEYDLGLISYEKGDIDEAIYKINKAIQINDSKVQYYRTLGKIYLENEDYENAIDNIRKAYNLDENDILTLNNAGCYYIISKDNIWRGYENLKAAYEEMPDNLDKDKVRAITKNYKEAKRIYDLSLAAEENGEIIDYDIPNFELFN